MMKSGLLLCFLFALPGLAAADNYYLGPWTFNEQADQWMIEGVDYSAIDFRAHGARNTPGTALIRTPQTLPSPYVFIGSDADGIIGVSQAVKDIWEQATGYRPVSSDLKQMILEQLTTGSSVDGVIRPLQPHAGKLRVKMNGAIIERDFQGINDTHFPKVQVGLQGNYRKIREYTLEGDLPVNTHRKYLDVLGEEFSVSDPQNYFIPDDLPKETPLDHETTISDDFTCADSDNPDCALDWIEYGTEDCDISVEQLLFPSQDASTDRVCYANSDLSSDDHSGSADIKFGGGFSNIYLLVSFDASTAEGYSAGACQGCSDWYIRRVDSGTSATAIATDSTCTISSFANYAVTLTNSGGAQEATFAPAGCDNLSATDTTHAGGLKAGFYSGGATTQWGDNFSVSDVVVGGGGWTGKVNGVSSPAKVNGVANASIASVSGVA